MWWKNVGGALLLYLAVGFAGIHGYNVNQTYQNESSIERNITTNQAQENSIRSNNQTILETQQRISELEELVENLTFNDDENVRFRSPGCWCIKQSNQGEQAWRLCPTKGPVCDSENRERCETENPGFEC